MSQRVGPSIDHAVIAVTSLDDAAGLYQELGFKLTPRAAHPDHMGTVNRLAQFAGGNFLELVEVDRPDLASPHDHGASPARFAFGAHNLAYLAKRQGMSALVFATDDAEAEAERLADAGLTPYQPLHFERRATQPDGSETGVAFTLAFATSPLMPDIAFYFCQNHYPENFWKPEFQEHANGARKIVGVTISAREPKAHADFLARLTGVAPTPIDGGIRVDCGAGHSLAVTASASESALFTRLEIATTAKDAPSVEAGGVTIDWRGPIS
jgi:catechol 2,3-dioxygenase-like lactoylglutathione lyase family enzyme